MMNPREEFVSVQEAANIMGLDRSRVGRLCREGRFPGAAKPAAFSSKAFSARELTKPIVIPW